VGADESWARSASVSVMAEPTRWCLVRVEDASGALRTETWLAGAGTPGLAVVDEVARLLLGARRAGHCARIEAMVPALDELVALAALPVEVRRQPERGEQPLRLEEREEEAHLGDPP